MSVSGGNEHYLVGAYALGGLIGGVVGTGGKPLCIVGFLLGGVTQSIVVGWIFAGVTFVVLIVVSYIILKKLVN